MTGQTFARWIVAYLVLASGASTVILIDCAYRLIRFALDVS